MACNSLCFCFSGEPLRPDEYGGEGGRGAAYEKYATNRETFQLGMGDAPLRAPLQCLAGGFPVTFVCCQWHMRYRALNHVAPGSEFLAATRAAREVGATLVLGDRPFDLTIRYCVGFGSMS